MADRKKVLILGGGFGGVKTALLLSNNPNFEVSLLSDATDFSFHPVLYKAATGGREDASSIPLNEIFAGKNIVLIRGSAKTLDRNKKTVTTSSGKTYHYDDLVIALGAITNFFGIKGLDQYAYGIKPLNEAKKLRQHLHKLILDEQKPDLNYVVIGGGPTGVELAGALPGYLRHIMQSHGIKSKALQIDLVEAESRLMPRMPRPYSAAVARRLRRLGVRLYLGQKVEAETAQELMIGGRDIKSHTVVWTAGVTNHPFFKTNNFKLTDHGKVSLDDYLIAEDNIYVIGDNADTPYSGMAQTALYDAVFVADNLNRLSIDRLPKIYRPKRPIYITPVGPYWAAVSWGGIHIYGWLGWVLRAAANLIAYHDLEPWWKASKHWQASFRSENNCPICKQ